jgi:2-keto-3-deoxy-L-rhamnonate aldolase RhmA
VGTVLEVGRPAYVEALDQVVVALMVEKAECVEDLDRILSVPGIDMVQFGAADYSMSIGVTGQFTHPDVKKAERRTIELALSKGLHPRIELHDLDRAPEYMEMGVKHFCIGWDVRILYNWLATNGREMRELLGQDTAPVRQPVTTGSVY